MNVLTLLRRRWFRFGLASLFWLTLVAAISTVAVQQHRQVLVLRQEIAKLQVDLARMTQAKSAAMKEFRGALENVFELEIELDELKGGAVADLEGPDELDM